MYVTVTVIFVFELHAWLCCILKKEKASEHKIVRYSSLIRPKII